ncbi:MAG TPA: DUF748 domain-containing protein [Thermoanaerobaculia bacterium]|nr:DUF748 domain-containing protein [Thermoanaerobaculia bacterium]
MATGPNQSSGNGSAVAEADAGERGSGARHTSRRWVRVLAIAAIAVALYALVGFFVVPRLIRWAVQEKGSTALHREVTVGKVAFNPFTLEADLETLRIRDRDRQPLFSFNRFHVDVQVSGILQRAWRLRELTIDEPNVAVRILRDGSLSIADLLKGDNKSSELPRVIVDHFAIRSGKVDFADDSVAPRFAASFTPVNVDVRDLVTLPGEQGEHALQIGFNRESTIRITGKQVIQPLGISGRIEAKNIVLATFAERLAAIAPIAIHRGHVDAGISYELRRRDPGGIQLDVSHGELTATDLALSPRGETAERLTVPRLEVRDATAAFPARRVEVGLVRLIEPRGTIAWDANGRFNWSGGMGSTEATRPAQSPPLPASEQWTVKVARAGIERGALHMDDQSATPAVAVDLSELAIEATGISGDAHAPIGLTASANANGSGRITLHGTLVPSPFSLDTQSSLSAIDLVPFRAYAASVHGMTLSTGTLGFDGRMLFSTQQPYLIEGNGTLRGIEFLDLQGRRFLGCKTASLFNIRIDGATSRNRIRRVDLDGMYANVEIDKQKNLNLSAIGSDATPAPKPADGTTIAKPAATGTGDVKPAAAKPAEPAKGSFDVGVIDIRNATVDYRDDSLVLPFATSISPATGKITDLSTTSKAASTVRFEGNVPEHGSTRADGTLRASDLFAGTDLTVRFRSVTMPRLTPYSAEFAGYEIERGLLDLDIHYRIADRKLVGDHRVVATDMTLGKKIGRSHAGFAVRLAVALLKDREGRIDLQVPIVGSVDSPEFNYRVVLWEAVKTILGNVVKAPFRALGRSMGIAAENLEFVSFDPGEASVPPPDAEKLAKVAGELAVRPELTLGVQGTFDPALDSAAIRKAKIDSAIASRRESPQAASAEPPSLESILEALYSQTFSAEKLSQERTKFTQQPPQPAPEQKSGRRAKSAPPPVPIVAGSFDAKGFYDELRAQLVAAQTVSAEELNTLARSRAAAVLAVLRSKGLAETRLKALPPAETKSKPGTLRVGSELKLSAQRAGAGDGED